MKYIQTVTGKIPADEMGITTTHEHLLIKQKDFNAEQHGEDEEYLNQKVCLRNRGKILYNLHKYPDNVILDNPDLITSEVLEFKKAGGKTLIDCTCHGLDPNPEAVRRIALNAGINIVMPTGVYTHPYHPLWVKDLSFQELAELFEKEINHGIAGTSIKAGFIGEIGISCFNNEEKKVVKAAAIAQKNTGTAIVFHMNHQYTTEVIDVLEKNGADLSKAIIGHCDHMFEKIDYFESLLKRKVNLAFDTFGMDITLSHELCYPNDYGRFSAIRILSNMGFINQIVVGHDVCFKVQLKEFGGFGYSHLLENVVLVMKNNGFSEDEINTLLVKNPARIFGVEED